MIISMIITVTNISDSKQHRLWVKIVTVYDNRDKLKQTYIKKLTNMTL